MSSPRHDRTTLAAIVLLSACGPEPHAPPPSPSPTQRAPSSLTAPKARTANRLAPHAYGRAGDLVLGAERAFYTFATAPDEAGKKPLRGALVDADTGRDDREDPILWFRPAVRDASGTTVAVVGAPEPYACAGGEPGLRLEGDAGAGHLVTTVCPERDGALRWSTVASGLPAGAELADDLGPGPSPVLLDAAPAAWEGTHDVRALAVEGPESTFVVVPTGGAKATRRLVHIAKETFPSPVTLTYGGTRADRLVRITHVKAALALAATGIPTVTGTFGLKGRAGHVSFLDAAGDVVTRLPIPPEGLATTLPRDFAQRAEVADARGVVCATFALTAHELATASCPSSARIGFTVHGDGHVPTPFHAIVRGEGDTPDPRLVDLVSGDAGVRRSVAAKNSVYSLDGRAEVEVRPGKYHVIVTRGPGSTLDERHVELGPGASLDVASELRNVLPEGAFSADFHLHAAPSPDSTVSLEERLVTLAAEGLSFAVATDHNRITDYAPARARLTKVPSALFPTLAIGDEITSGGSPLFGHFNAFPLPAPAAGMAPEAATIPYFGVAPRELFAGARRAGAAIVQVNHPRMPPKIGYFDQTGFDATTGKAGADFADDFDAVEAHNGIWLESPDRVREGYMDLVGLARRGKLVAATGNSDSHKLFLEEPGYPRTYVTLPVGNEPTEARVTAALRARSTVVSSGPYLEATIDGARPGSVVKATKGRVTVALRVFAPAWIPVESIEILVDGKAARTLVVQGKPKNGKRFEATVSLTLDHDATVGVWVEAKTPLPRVLHEKDARAIAFTTPFFVDADGDGRFSAK
jgi:hypothetical protein